jgi:hypothetical protein
MILDGTFEHPQADPIVGWRIVNLVFDLDGDGSAIAQVGYYRQSGDRASMTDLQFTGDAYSALITALGTPLADEGNVTSLGGVYRRRAATHIATVLNV